ncbi:GP46-like surface antigen, putative, partial [Bodo saltans]
MTTTASLVLCVVAAALILQGATAACICDTNTDINNALLSLKSSLNITGWTAASSCSWPGVTCSSSLTGLTLCSTAFIFGAPCVGGSLPTTTATWQYLGTLTSLVISNTGSKITGSFPVAASTSLTKLSSLTFNSYSPTGTMQLPTGSTTGYSMVLSSSTITITGSSGANIISLSASSSPVPDVSNIASLRTININAGSLATLSWTSMTGLTSIGVSSVSASILPSWTNTNFPSLQSIVLYSVTAATTFPTTWSTLTTLTAISISYCTSLTASLPTTWSSLTNLKSLNVYSTPIAGPLPSTWSSLAITSISIYSASLSGATLPSSWTQMTSLTTLAITSSNLGGTLPPWQSTTLLTYLGLGSNSISGPLPTTVIGWSHLVTLDLSNNPINSTIPSWQLASLTSFSCSSCNLIGPLPSWGSGSTPMGSLRTISISSNMIGSSIPTTWGQMAALAYLYAASSSITGQLPLTWTSTSLQGISLSGNAITGNIATLTFSSTSLSSIDLSTNRIGPACSFTVPSMLSMLKLNDNQCTGVHPNWGSATSLSTVDIGGNAFSGSLARIPSTALRILRVDRGNRFTGSLFNWTASTYLYEVRANNNWFSGTLPAFSSSASLETLLFAANNLSGTFPAGTDLSNIELLDLSANNFVGTVPLLTDSSYLDELNISFNSFTGTLSLDDSSSSSLTLLDVSCNFLSGTVPPWSGARYLANVNLTCGNDFSGTLPAFSSLAYNYLVTLDVTDQGLTGTLSTILGSTLSGGSSSAVTSMLLGGNSFSGTMPQFLKWSQLVRFNASGNNLIGSLATTGGTFPSNLWSVDISNNNALRGTVPVPSSTSVLQHFLLGGDAHTFSGTLPSLHAIFPNLTRFSLSGSFPVTFPYAWLVGSA